MKNKFSVICARILCLALLTIMVFALAVPALAYEGAYDTEKQCSILFDMKIVVKNVTYRITGGSVALYKIASRDPASPGRYIPEPSYDNLNVDFSLIGSNKSTDAWISNEIALYIRNHGLEDTAVDVYDIDDDGYGKAEDLDTGLYLAVQQDPPKGYYSFLPFIIELPEYNNATGLYNYDRTASPKYETENPVKGVTQIIPTILKEINGKDAPAAEFRFLFRSLDAGNPDVVSSSGSVDIGGDVVSQTEGEIIVRTIGADSAELGTITFSKPGDYIYEVSEINTKESGFSYDKTVYWCKFTIRKDDEAQKLYLARTVIKNGYANGDILYEGIAPETFVFTFVNDYEWETPPEPPTSDSETETAPPETEETETTPPPPTDTTETSGHQPGKPPYKDTKEQKLPQTGQVWWPMFVLAAVGIVCIAAGAAISKRSRKGKK